jgi:hypothetical protein
MRPRELEGTTTWRHNTMAYRGGLLGLISHGHSQRPFEKLVPLTSSILYSKRPIMSWYRILTLADIVSDDLVPHTNTVGNDLVLYTYRGGLLGLVGHGHAQRPFKKLVPLTSSIRY